MKRKICNSLICAVLAIIFIVGSVPFYAKSSADEVNSLVSGAVSYKASSLGVTGKQGIVDYYTSAGMESGGEWYVLSFLQNGDKLNNSSYEKALINYLKNNEVYSATSREKFSLTLIALGTKDKWAKNYISETANEAIGKQGIMSLVFGLHLLNNGCKSELYSASSLVEKIFSLQNSDGGWANSGTASDVDVTSMTLQAVSSYRKSYSSKIENAINFLSSKQSDDGDFLSYGVYNAESTAQVVIALSSLGIDCNSDSRFIKNSHSVIDGLKKFKNSDGSFCHVIGGGANNSATSQAHQALVSYLRFLRGNGSFYKFSNQFSEKTTSDSVTSTASQGDSSGGNTNKDKEKTTSSSSDRPEVTSSVAVENSTGVTNMNGKASSPGENGEEISQNDNETASDTGENESPSVLLTDENGSQVEEQKNESIISEIKERAGTPKELKIKLIIISVIVAAAVILSVILVLLKKRNIKNFIVIGVAVVISVTSVLFIRIHTAEDYYNSSVNKNNTVGHVYLTVRCDTIMGKDGAPDNPVILEKGEYEIKEGDTVYVVLAEALRENGIMFEHNSSYYISGINNLYEFEYGDLSGWMYLVNGETPSVGCGEYVLKDGDDIQWLYTCDIGNDLKTDEKN
ncbi:MAG: DUF4430 domain-containing protein [Ruminococcaceae bacterium]|nr:DUF4430 domain-containing protein [Oscillospiraceae bacterium]